MRQLPRTNMSNPPQFSAAPPPWPSQSRGPTQWLSAVSLAVAVLAICVAIGAWFRPASSDKPASAAHAWAYSAPRVADSKTSLCRVRQSSPRTGSEFSTKRGAATLRPSLASPPAAGKYSMRTGTSSPRHLKNRLSPPTSRLRSSIWQMDTNN